jgi:GNAT superfamily N-acetyltransferase
VKFWIRRATGVATERAALTEVLIDCVEGGASVSFMLPLSRDRAAAFWDGVFHSADRGERIVLVAEDRESQTVVGTVQVLLKMPENQPHRAEISKMLVHRIARRQGLGDALMRAAELAALEAGKTLLVLDTADETAERLYTRLGWQQAGIIPDFAHLPAGGLVPTTLFYKRLDS